MIPKPTVGLTQKNVKINIRPPTNFRGLEDVDQVMMDSIIDMAIEAKSVWETEAGQRLSTSRDRYIKALRVDTDYVGVAYVELDPEDSFIKMIENGVAPWDMKPGFLFSPKARMSVMGTLYNIIPMGPDHSGPLRFRTVSTTSPPKSWYYANKTNGLKGVHIRDEVVEQLRSDIIPRHFKAAIAKVNARK